MANPTGTIYLTAAPGYVWTDGDVYQIAQTDQQEGAATGASFGGLGVDNQAHQILLNKIQLTRVKQLVDETNISALQTWQARFSGSLGATSGFMQVPFLDSSLGSTNYLVQFGTIDLGSDAGEAIYGPYSWPTPFPAAVRFFTLATITDESPNNLSRGDNVFMVPTASTGYGPTRTQFYAWNNNLGAGVNGARGFTFFAVGY